MRGMVVQRADAWHTGRRPAALAVAAALALGMVALASTPAHAGAVLVGNDAEFRAAWESDEPLITLTDDIDLSCVASATRSSAIGVVVDGAGFTIDNACAGLTALVSDGTGSVTLRNLTLTGDTTTAGGFEGDSDLIVESSSITGHGGHGIELSSDGADLTMTSSTVSNNGLDDFGDGDGIAMRIATATITGSTISGNQGDGIDGEGDVNVTGSTISNNVEENGILSEGDVTVTGSTISNNGVDDFSCGDGIEADGDAIVTNSTISGNADVGILAGGNVVATGSTISGNGVDSECDDGGILTDDDVSVIRSTVSSNEGSGVVGGDVTLDASTISGNTDLGAWSNGGALLVTNSTITGNASVGLVGHDIVVRHGTISGNSLNIESWDPLDTLPMPPTLRLFATVVIDPTGGSNCLEETVVDDGHNFIDDASCGSIPANAADPQLAALGSNGGPTQTRLPAATSPLVNAIPLVDCDATVTTDQRGLPRPGGTGCDIGSVELQPAPPPASPTSPAASAPAASVPAASQLPNTAAGDGAETVPLWLFAMAAFAASSAALLLARRGSTALGRAGG